MPPVPEYMRVRTFIYNLIENSDGTNLQIPPENELSKLFNVSRVTVRGAIKKLVSEGYLIPRRGIGTFINRKMLNTGIVKQAIIGLLEGSGDRAANSYYSNISICVMQNGMQSETLYFPESDDPQRMIEIIRSGVRGVIWADLTKNKKNIKYIEALNKNKIPLLLIGNENFSAQDCLISTKAQRGVAFAEYMYSKGHIDILTVHNNTSVDEHFLADSTFMAYCNRMSQLSGRDGNKLKENICSLSDLKAKLKESNRRFTAIYTGFYNVPYVKGELLLAGIEIPRDLSFLTYGRPSSFHFDGKNADYLDIETCWENEVSDWLTKRIVNNDNSEIIHKEITMKIVPGETVKTI